MPRLPSTSFKIPLDLLAKIDAIAKAENRSRAFIVIRILRAALG